MFGPVKIGLKGNDNQLYPIPDLCLTPPVQVLEANLAVARAGHSETSSTLHDSIGHVADTTLVYMKAHDNPALNVEAELRAARANWCTWCGVGKSKELPYKDKKTKLDESLLGWQRFFRNV